VKIKVHRLRKSSHRDAIEYHPPRGQIPIVLESRVFYQLDWKHHPTRGTISWYPLASLA